MWRGSGEEGDRGIVVRRGTLWCDGEFYLLYL